MGKLTEMGLELAAADPVMTLGEFMDKNPDIRSLVSQFLTLEKFADVDIARGLRIVEFAGEIFQSLTKSDIAALEDAYRHGGQFPNI